MKKLWSATANFIVFFFVATLLIAFVFLLKAMVDGNMNKIPLTFMYMIISCLPLALLVATVKGFFYFNKIFSSRLLGWLFIYCLSFIIFAIFTLPSHFGLINENSLPNHVPASYRLIAIWIHDLISAPLWDYLLGLVTYSAFITTLWGASRVSRSRPLMGVFASFASVILVLYVMQLFLSGLAMRVTTFLGMQVSKTVASSLLMLLAAIVFASIDILLARKPSGELNA